MVSFFVLGNNLETYPKPVGPRLGMVEYNNISPEYIITSLVYIIIFKPLGTAWLTRKQLKNIFDFGVAKLKGRGL